MIQHNLKVAFRNLLKYKVQMGISIVGLSTGFTCLILSLLWIHYEETYDTFHKESDCIYMAGDQSELQGDGFYYHTSSLLADFLVKNYPEIEKACHINSGYVEDIEIEKVCLKKVNWLMVDSTFISMFNITVLDGDSRLRMDQNQIAITEKIAQQLFGKENPIGKQLSLTNDKKDDEKKTIVAVVKAWEGHSSYPFDILMPYKDLNKPSWGIQQCYTLFRVYPNCDIKSLKKKLANFEVQQNDYKQTISVPISLLSELRSEHPQKEMNVRQDHIRLFAAIGALVVICGLCNYLTMLITRIRMRKRELALRKVNGASNRGLLALILTELLLILVFSLIIGFILIEIVLPKFKEFSQINENTQFFYNEILVYMLLLVLITISVAALLIFYINKRTLSDSISYKLNLHLSGWFYKGSILFQLFISIGFIFCTLVMMKQLNFLLNTRELGIERHNVGVVTNAYNCDYPLLKKTLDQMPEVVHRLKGFYTPIPKMLFTSNVVYDWEGKQPNDQSVKIEQEVINQDYVDFFGIELLEGEMVGEKDEKESVIINETAVKAFGWDHPVGKKIKNNQLLVVKGVIKDIYYNAPVHPVTPAIFSYQANKDDPQVNEHIIFKVKEGTWKMVIEKLKAEAKKANQDAELYIINMEEIYDNYMKSEQNLMKLLSIVSFVCIVIAVFGIFSFVTLSCQQRRKEIAIRKVNGANTGIILNMFFKEYLSLLILASFIAFPLGFVFMDYWLEGYVKQTSITWWIYGGIFVLMALIVFLSIIWRVWKTIRQNPAEVIKNE